jgi:hypothetical protein
MIRTNSTASDSERVVMIANPLAIARGTVSYVFLMKRKSNAEDDCVRSVA